MEILCARFIPVRVLGTTLLGFVKIERRPLLSWPGPECWTAKPSSSVRAGSRPAGCFVLEMYGGLPEHEE